MSDRFHRKIDTIEPHRSFPFNGTITFGGDHLVLTAHDKESSFALQKIATRRGHDKHSEKLSGDAVNKSLTIKWDWS